MYLIDFGRNLFKKSNIGVIVYLVLNTIIYVALFGGFADPGMAGLAILIYLITLCIALSPVGEFLLRMQTGCKKIKRKDYLERLMPIFEEVYAQARKKDPSISDKVKLYMSGSKTPNAFATGRKTICITKGFLGYSDAQIKGTLAHEFAHLAHKDTDLLLVILVGNMLMTALFVLWRIVINIFVFMFASALRMRFLGTFLTSLFINLLLTFLMWVWTKIGMLLCMHSSRQNEFNADKFAFELGYGNDLCVVLDSLGGGDDEQESRSVWKQLHDSHPAIDDRVAKLQELGATYTNMHGHNLKAVNANPGQYGFQHETPPVLPQAPPMGAAAFTGRSAPAATAAPPAAPAKRFCTSCGSQTAAGTSFCANCGAAIT
jgi:heat shock protein HtpX